MLSTSCEALNSPFSATPNPHQGTGNGNDTVQDTLAVSHHAYHMDGRKAQSGHTRVPAALELTPQAWGPCWRGGPISTGFSTTGSAHVTLL